MTRAHRHRAEDVDVRPFAGPVRVLGQEPRAHGGILEIERCRCGARRAVNVNGRWRERGEWYREDGGEP